MAVDDLFVIDGIGVNYETGEMGMLMSDHLAWEGEDALDEEYHLQILQEKLNTYAAYIEEKQYKKKYKYFVPRTIVIRACFLYEISDRCAEFLAYAQEQIEDLGMRIEVIIG
jgi:hypothetical protein